MRTTTTTTSAPSEAAFARSYGRNCIDAIRAGNVEDARTWASFAAHKALNAMHDAEHAKRCVGGKE